MRDQVFSVIGAPALISHIRAFRAAAEAGCEKGIIDAANLLLEESNKLCPIDTGALRASGHVIVEGSGFKTKAYIVYDAEYAIYVHENLDAYHEPPTQAKYLEETMRRYRKDALLMVSREIKRAVAAARFWRNMKTSLSSYIGAVAKSTKIQIAKQRARIKGKK